MSFNTSISHILASCRIAFILPFICLTAASANASSDSKEAKVSLANPKIAKKAGVYRLLLQKEALPTIQYTNSNGELQTLDTTGAKLTALHFWATWCGPCLTEMPKIDAILKEYADKGFHVVTLALEPKKKLDDVKKFLKEKNITMLEPNLDIGAKAMRVAQVRGLPTTIFIDSEGNEVARAKSTLDWKSERVTQLLNDYLN